MVLGRLGLLRHHEVHADLAPVYRRAALHRHHEGEARHQRWTVDPWTHDHGDLPDVWKIERWSAGG